MSFLITFPEPAFNKTEWGDIPKFTHTNYDEWKDDMILILSAMKVYAIVTGDNPEPQPHNFDHDDNYHDWKAKEAEVAYIIRLSYSPEVRRIVKGIRNPHEIWNILETSLDTAGSYSICRQDILCQFCACRPKEDEPLKAYFTKLSNYRIQLDHTDDAITDNGGVVLRQSQKKGLISMSTQGRIHCLFRGFQRCEMVTPITERHSWQRLTTTANQLRQSGSSCSYHHGNHKGSH